MALSDHFYEVQMPQNLPFRLHDSSHLLGCIKLKVYTAICILFRGMYSLKYELQDKRVRKMTRNQFPEF